MSDDAVLAPGAFEGGEVPEPLTAWFGDRDQSPLAAGVLARWQVRSRARTLANNHRAELADDGALRVVWHPEGGAPAAAFTEPLPGSPTARVGPEVLDELRRRLDDERFADLSPYQSSGAEDGDAVAVRARVAGGEREVFYIAVDSPLITWLTGLVRAHA